MIKELEGHAMDNGFDINESPVVRFVNRVLSQALEHNADRVIFHKVNNKFYIDYEINGRLNNFAKPPIGIWVNVISRLKVMAKMVDYGPNKSRFGCIEFLGQGRAAAFKLTTNPNPHHAHTVVVMIEPLSSN